MLRQPPIGDPRTESRIRHHYEIERQLATRLRDAGRTERAALYTALYDEMFRQVPDHPMLLRKTSARERAHEVNEQMKFLGRFIGREAVFAEMGPGDCALMLRVAPTVSHAIGVDVSPEISAGVSFPANARLVISDGVSVPVPDATLDVVYSNQLMEHLHPEDAIEQLRNIHRALKPGGRYVCVTPNRLTGPHDVSAYFSDVAEGFHLKEYTFGELHELMRRAGFATVRAYLGGKGRFVRVPARAVALVEGHFDKLDAPRRRQLRGKLPLRLLSSIRIEAIK